MSSARSTASVYWIRSLVPIDRKSSRFRNAEIASTAAGISIIPPIGTPESNGTPCSRSVSFACAIIASVWSISPTEASIGIRIFTVAVVRRAQDRAELREEEPRLGQAEADRAQAERGIRGDAREPVEPGRLLVRAQVERADRHRLAAHALGDAAVRLELLVLGRQALAIEEQELGAEEADAGRAVLERLRQVARQLDVRLELDLDAVDRRRGLRDEPLQPRPLERELALLQPVLGQHRLVRVDDDDVVRAVDDQELVLADQLPRVVRRDDRGHREAPRDDRRVRRRAADVGEKRREPVLLELDHVGRREVVRDQDRVLLGARRRDGPRLAQQALQDPLDDLHDVGLALAQIRVVDRCRTARPARSSAARAPTRRCTAARR